YLLLQPRQPHFIFECLGQKFSYCEKTFLLFEITDLAAGRQAETATNGLQFPQEADPRIVTAALMPPG
ncbi:hypothetical protein, partial [Arthrobacter oryzae]